MSVFLFVVAVVDCSVSVCFGFLGCVLEQQFVLFNFGLVSWGVLEHNFSCNRSKFKFACHTMVFHFSLCFLFVVVLDWLYWKETQRCLRKGNIMRCFTSANQPSTLSVINSFNILIVFSQSMYIYNSNTFTWFLPADAKFNKTHVRLKPAYFRKNFHFTCGSTYGKN